MTDYEALETAEMFTDDEIAALRSLANDMAMDQTERFGIPALYPMFRRHFLHQGLSGMITGRLNILSIQKEHPNTRRPLHARERMTRGQARRWLERAMSVRR